MTKNSLISVFILCLTLCTAAGTLHGADKTDPPTGKYFFIKSVQAGTGNLGFWDQPGIPARYKRGANLALYRRDNHSDQKFRFVSAGRGWYNIVSANGGHVDVAGGKNANGVNVLIWQGHKGSNQKFRFKHMGNGRWKIFTWKGRVICTPRRYSNGSNVHTWADHNGPWMEWYLVDARTGKNYAPETYSRKPDFFINNKSKAFNYTSETLVGRDKGKAYVLQIQYNRIISVGLEYTRTNQRTGKPEKVSTIMKINYSKGKYTVGPADPEFQLAGQADGNAKTLSMSHSQGGIRFDVTSEPGSSIIPKTPAFFIKNKGKTFTYRMQTAFGGGSEGTAKVKRIRGNMVELAVTSTGVDMRTGKKKTTTSARKIYFIKGMYTYNQQDYPTSGIASGSDKSLDISGEQSSETFSIK